MKSKLNLFVIWVIVASCNSAPKARSEASVKQEIKPEQTMPSVESLQSTNKEPNAEFELEILTQGKFKTPDVSMDSTNEYGAGDCFGKVTYYSQRNAGLGIDSMSCGEYGYTKTHYLLKSKNEIQAVYLKKSESLLQEDGNWKYALTEKIIDFRNNQVTVRERIDTLIDHTKSKINKEFEIKKLKDEHASLKYWNKEFRELWEKEESY